MRVPPKITNDPVSVAELSRMKRIQRAIECEGEIIEVMVQRTGWRPLDYDYRDVRRRFTLAEILVEGRHAGTVLVHEYDLRTIMASEQFFTQMDDVSHITSQLASVLCSHWEDVCDVMDYGQVVEIQRAWMRPELSGRGRLASALRALIAEFFKGHALLTLKAFPLQFEGAVTEDNSAIFNRRKRAMMRLYTGMLGVAPFPGPAGDDGWMYSIPERLLEVLPTPEPGAGETS